MKHRSVGSVILLSLFTLGIYTLFWLAETRREMTNLGHRIPPVKYLLAPIFFMIVVIPLQFIVHFVFSTVDGSGSIGSDNLLEKIVNIFSLLVPIVAIIGLIPVSLWWFYRYCQAVEVTTNQQTSFGVSYGLLLVCAITGLSFVWPGLIQDGFNKLAEPTD